MDELKLNHENTPDPMELAFLDRKISEFCFSEIGQFNYNKLALFFRDRNRNIVAGLYSHTGLGWLYIDVLWVEKNFRSNGLGTRLMETAEYEAISRECHDAYLYTYSFQNPNFYERLGYQIFGQLNNFPDEHTKYFMKKALIKRGEEKDK